MYKNDSKLSIRRHNEIVKASLIFWYLFDPFIQSPKHWLKASSMDYLFTYLKTLKDLHMFRDKLYLNTLKLC